jgi:predicted lipoprotein with Yx(FWY)xxD motif
MQTSVRLRRPGGAVALLIVAAMGCAKADKNAAADSTAAATSKAAAAATDSSATQNAGSMAMLDAAKLPSGEEYLTDTEGRALYFFDKDRHDSSSCNGACAAAWPAVTSNGAPMAHNAAIAPDKLGTVRRPDGSTQVVYDHKPLYYSAKDKARGDIKGQRVQDFGGEWFLLKPNGEKQEARK